MSKKSAPKSAAKAAPEKAPAKPHAPEFLVELIDARSPTGHEFEAQAVADGRVNSIGVSNFLVPDLERLLSRASIRPAVNQIERHPYFQQRELAAFLAANDIAAEAWYPLGHGSKDLLAEPVFTALAAKYSKTAVQVILRWHLQTGFVAIPKSTNTHHIEQNLDRPTG